MDNDDGDSANAYGDNEYGYPVYQDNDNGVMAVVMKDTMCSMMILEATIRMIKTTMTIRIMMMIMIIL